MHELYCHVDSIELIGNDVQLVKLASDELNAVNYLGGQYLTLQVDGGRWIPFSIGNAPEEKTHIELHIKLIPGHELAEQIITQLKTNKSAHVQIPMGKCVLRDSGRDSVFIVGGTGFSPAKAMLESAFYQKDSRNFYLFWGAKHSSELYLSNIAESWQQSHSNFDYVPVISGEQKEWAGETGFAHQPALKRFNNLPELDFYIAGSPEMVMAVYQELLDAGVPKEQIFADMLDIKREMGEQL
ncbi:MAG: NAD(P)H-flavin reductase [Gammaproteobacteria bacterium]|nr:NAD(P)H-flavin reductase [Gammaproteobacteria bacterium]